MTGDDKLTQNESRFVVEWLRKQYGLRIGYKLQYWNLRPSSVADQIKKEQKVQVTTEEIIRAARRDN